MKRIPLVLFIIISQIYIFASNFQLLQQYNLKNKTEVYNFNHIFWAHDYDLYLSAVTEGKDGNLLFSDNYTTEKTVPSIFYVFYMFIGKIAALFGLTPVFAYHLVRIISQEIFILLVFMLSKEFLGNRFGIIASFIALTSTVAPSPLFTKPLEFGINQPWFLNFDALERLNTLPHYLASWNFLLLAAILLLRYLKDSKSIYAIISSVCILLSGIFFPATLVSFAATIPILIFFALIRKTNKLIPGLLIILVAVFAAYLIMSNQETHGFPWEIWRSWNIERWNRGEADFDRNSLFVFGILPFFSLLSVTNIIKSKSPAPVFFLIWAYLPFVLLPFADILKLPKLRLLEDAHFVPFALLSGFILSKLKYNKKILNLAVVVFIASSVLMTGSLFWKKYEFNSRKQYADLFYYSINEKGLLEFIAVNTPGDSVFLSDQRIGLLIPAETPRKSYFAHMTLTKNFLKKMEKVKTFYSGRLSSTDARNFLTENGIGFVYFGTDEKRYGTEKLGYGFLSEVYKNPGGTLYKFVKPQF